MVFCGSNGVFHLGIECLSHTETLDLVQSPIFHMVSTKDKYEKPTKRVHELWQTDFTQFKVIDWG